MKSKKGCILSILLGCFIIGVSIPLFMTNHKKVKADTISDLTNTTWILKETLASTISVKYINFTSNNNNYTQISMSGTRLKYNTTTVWDDGWNNEEYRTIVITGGNDVTDSTLISWLETNATTPTPPTPPGTRITYKYWSPMGNMRMTDNQVIGDEEITYTVLFNEQRRQYDETTQTGLIFKGMITTDNVPHSYIESINGPGINILYMGDNNDLINAMWLEFTYGDYMDSDLYDSLTLWGVWFDDAEADVYLVGMNQGYAEGFESGRASGQADGTQYTGLITGIFNGLGGLLSIQVFPNITIGLLIGLPLLLGALIIILKILRG